MSQIAIHNVTKIFGPNPERGLRRLRDGADKDAIQQQLGLVVGVNNATFTIEAGEIFVVMGLSGSGKSTLLRCLNRLHEPTAGTIEIGGQDITKLDRRSLMELRRNKFGMVFQSFALLPHRTVIGNVEYGLEVRGMDVAKRRGIAQETIESVGLKGWEEHFPHELSGGMQQRVGLARALAVDPDILLMDEAFSALDPLIRREMQDELLDLQARLNKTIVFITHDLDEALKVGDRIAVMRDGEIIQIGTPEEIVSAPAGDYVTAFIEGVDRSKVLTAGAIMQRPKEVATLRDGPRSILRKLQQSGLSSIFLVDRERRLLGLLEAKAVARAVRDADGGEVDLSGALTDTFPQVAHDRPLREVIALGAGISGPIAVVDDNERLAGVIVKGAILAALVQRGEIDEALAHDVLPSELANGDEPFTTGSAVSGDGAPTNGGAASGDGTPTIDGARSGDEVTDGAAATEVIDGVAAEADRHGSDDADGHRMPEGDSDRLHSDDPGGTAKDRKHGDDPDAPRASAGEAV